MSVWEVQTPKRKARSYGQGHDSFSSGKPSPTNAHRQQENPVGQEITVNSRCPYRTGHID